MVLSRENSVDAVLLLYLQMEDIRTHVDEHAALPCLDEVQYDLYHMKVVAASFRRQEVAISCRCNIYDR